MKIKRFQRNQKGFTLLEMSIVMIASGFLMIVLMGMLKYREVYLEEKAERQMERIQFGLAEYFRVFGHYPCPADPADSYGTANFGLSDFATAGKTLIPPVGGQACTANQGDLPVKSLNAAVGCVTNTAQDVQDVLDGAIGANPPSARANLIFNRLQKGLQSYRSRTTGSSPGGTRLDYCLPDNLAVDIHDHKLTYAVGTTSTRATVTGDNTTYRANNGSLNLFDQNGNRAATLGAHYIIISHGEDGEGAISYGSNAVTNACTAVASGAPNINDGENCDGDSDFLIATIADEPTSVIQNDDLVSFSIMGQKIEMEPGVRTQNGLSENLSFGDGTQNMWVNIGRVEPANKTANAGLAVGGDVMVDNGMLNAQGSLETVPGQLMDVNVDNWIRADEVEATRYCYTVSPFSGGGC